LRGWDDVIMGLCGIGEGIVGCGSGSGRAVGWLSRLWVAVSELMEILVMYGIVLAMAVGRGSMRMLVMTALQL
jgi:hypothetical protein